MEGVDTPKEAALKVAKFIIEDAYAPRLIADSWEAFRAVGKDAALTREGPGMIFWSGMFPFRIHQVDPRQPLHLAQPHIADLPVTGLDSCLLQRRGRSHAGFSPVHRVQLPSLAFVGS